MRAFLVGLLFLICIGVFSLAIIILTPLLAALNFVMYLFLFIAVLIFLVWLLGKFLLWAWKEIRR